MEDNKTIILQEFKDLKGQFVITSGWNIERLVAVGEDDMDYYWITYNGRKFKWNTCVGRLMPLKGHLQDEDYNELVRLAQLNHFDQSTIWGHKNPEEAKQFNIQHKHELMQLSENERFLTDVCWDLEPYKENC
jgi:hydroxymethylpyrimidine pyrophosphatase-like HAD family hydrolase